MYFTLEKHLYRLFVYKISSLFYFFFIMYFIVLYCIWLNNVCLLLSQINANFYLYIKLNTHIFTTDIIHSEFSTCLYKFIGLLCTEKPVLNANLKFLWCTNHQICFGKICILRLKRSPHTTRNSSLKYVFVVFFETNLMLKYIFRKSRDLRSLLTAALITLAVLDILDILRVASSIVVNIHTFVEVGFYITGLPAL